MALPARRDELALRFRDGAWRLDRRDRTDGAPEVSVRGTPEDLIQRLREAGGKPRLGVDEAGGQYRTVTLRSRLPADSVTFTLWRDGDRTRVSATASIGSRFSRLVVVLGAGLGLALLGPEGGALMWLGLGVAMVSGTFMMARRSMLIDADIARGEALANHFTRALAGRIHEGEETEDPFREA